MGIMKQTAIFVAVTGLLFILAEGLSSTTIALRELLRNNPHPEINHYDDLLGWASLPDTYIPDMYGPGVYVRTNSRGFRNDDETLAVAPDGKTRVICSGDSFTYGEGVANNHSWCHFLSVLDDGLDNVNLGQPGYGVDQMYLRYIRDGIDLEHSVHLFAFIGADLDRMGFSTNYHYGKPVLDIAGETLVVENSPVPYLRPAIGRALARADFRTVDFGKRVTAKLFRKDPEEVDITERIGPVAAKVFQEISRLGEENNVYPVFVYLPVLNDIRNDRQATWHGWVIETMHTLGLPFIDLTPALQALPAGVAASFFIAPGEPEAGHYSAAGNEWVAGEIYRQLQEIPRIRTLLAATK